MALMAMESTFSAQLSESEATRRPLLMLHYVDLDQNHRSGQSKSDVAALVRYPKESKCFQQCWQVWSLCTGMYG